MRAPALFASCRTCSTLCPRIMMRGTSTQSLPRSKPIPQPCCMLGRTALQEMTRASALATAAPVPRGCAQPRRCFPARSNAPRGGRAGVTDVVQQFVAGLPADAAAAGAYLQREAGAASAVGGVAAAALAAAARALAAVAGAGAARAGALGTVATSALAAGAALLSGLFSSLVQALVPHTSPQNGSFPLRPGMGSELRRRTCLCGAADKRTNGPHVIRQASIGA